MRTLWHIVVAVLVAALLQSLTVTGNFQLEVEVTDVHDPIDDCGGGFERCHLYIEEFCLDPQSEELHYDEEEEEECSLIEIENNFFDLDSGLPKTKTLSVTNHSWPIDFRLGMEIMDHDCCNKDDHIEDLLVLESLNTSSEFSEERGYKNTPDGRITLTLRFRVQCTGGYEGPHCDCLPHNDTTNGHYSCREDGGISCLPGYSNTSNLCRERDYCMGVVCPSNGTCVNTPTSHVCQPPPNTSPTTSTDVTDPDRDNCNCTTGMNCIEEEGGGYRCVCPEGFTGETCSTPVVSTTAPRQQSEESSGMPPAAIAAIVAGLLVALCAVVVVVVVCILLRKRSSKRGKVSGRGTRAPAKVSLSLADNHQNGVMSNPMYGDPGLIGENGDTLRNLPNPFYNYGRVNSNMADNPLYRDHPSQPPAAQQGDNIYSVPRDSPTASPERGGEGGVRYYSVPKSPAVEAGEVYSYATVGATGGGGDADSMPIEGPRYATPAARPQYAEARYNTLDHGLQQPPERQPTLPELTEGYDTLKHDDQH